MALAAGEIIAIVILSVVLIISLIIIAYKCRNFILEMLESKEISNKKKVTRIQRQHNAGINFSNIEYHNNLPQRLQKQPGHPSNKKYIGLPHVKHIPHVNMDEGNNDDARFLHETKVKDNHLYCQSSNFGRKHHRQKMDSKEQQILCVPPYTHENVTLSPTDELVIIENYLKNFTESVNEPHGSLEEHQRSKLSSGPKQSHSYNVKSTGNVYQSERNIGSLKFGGYIRDAGNEIVPQPTDDCYQMNYVHDDHRHTGGSRTFTDFTNQGMSNYNQNFSRHYLEQVDELPESDPDNSLHSGTYI